MRLHTISQTGEYALRAMVCLAERGDAPMTGQELSDRTGVPERYMAKVLGELGKAGFVAGQRGTHGGFTLIRKPQGVSVLDVVKAVTPSCISPRLPGRKLPRADGLFRLEHCLDDVAGMVERALSEQSIGELAGLPEQQAGKRESVQRSAHRRRGTEGG